MILVVVEGINEILMFCLSMGFDLYLIFWFNECDDVEVMCYWDEINVRVKGKGRVKWWIELCDCFVDIWLIIVV